MSALVELLPDILTAALILPIFFRLHFRSANLAKDGSGQLKDF